jgi:hypothetical protein
MDTTVAQTRLATIIRKLALEKETELNKLKSNYSDLARPDFLWHYLLQSFSTMGKSSGWHGLIGNQANYKQVTYQAVSALPPPDRLSSLLAVCRAAKVRMPAKKAGYIQGCYVAVRDMGGPVAAKAKLLSQPGREGKIKFLKALPGIGDKYARNIMMDVYHEDFRNSIAVDARIKALSEALGLSFPSYQSHERFYLGVAATAGINGWELDRLMYNFRHEIERKLQV